MRRRKLGATAPPPTAKGPLFYADRISAPHKVAEIAAAPLVGHNGCERIGGRCLVATALIIGEEEHPVAHEGTAEGAAEDVAREFRLAAAQAVGAPGVCGQPVVAPVFEGVAMELIRA